MAQAARMGPSNYGRPAGSLTDYGDRQKCSIRRNENGCIVSKQAKLSETGIELVIFLSSRMAKHGKKKRNVI